MKYYKPAKLIYHILRNNKVLIMDKSEKMFAFFKNENRQKYDWN